ncbi:MAG: hypothetical protein QW666_03530 [Candidatus Woesearchaeota archaeon]
MQEAYFGFPGNGVQNAIYFERKNIDIPENQWFLNEMNNVAQCDLVGKMFDKKKRKEITDEKEIQISIVGSSYLLANQLKKKIKCQGTFGLSLGEITAATAAESIEDPVAALYLARERAIAMSGCIPKKKIVTIDELCNPETGKYMAAVTGLSYRIVNKVCIHVSKKRKYGSVIAANENTPKQVVISGAEEAVERASKIIKRKWPNSQINSLNTSGPWHNPDYMIYGYTQYMRALDATKFSIPKTKLYLMSAQDFVSDPVEIKEHLGVQMLKPVRFWSGLINIIKAGYRKLVDVGSGGVLKKFFENTPEAVVLDKDAILNPDAAEKPAENQDKKE